MFFPCKKCGKQTNSHPLLEGVSYYCHTCFMELTPTEFEELKKAYRMETARITVELVALTTQSLGPRIRETIEQLKERRKNGQT